MNITASYLRALIFPALAGAILLSVSGCSQYKPYDPMSERFYMDASGGVIHLMSFGSQNDLTPPSQFQRFVIGLDEGDTKRIVEPTGLASSKDRLYITDGRRKSGYWVFHIPTKNLRLIQHASLANIAGIVVDDQNHKYLVGPDFEGQKLLGTFKTNEEKGKVVVFDQNDNFIKMAEVPGRPVDVGIYGDKLFYVDWFNSRIVILNKNTLDVIGTLGKKGVGDTEFQYPMGITVDEKGLIYVTDTFNGRIKIFDQEGNVVSRYGHRVNALGHFIKLQGIDVDKDGMVYVIEGGYARKKNQEEVVMFLSKNFYTKKEKVPPSDINKKDKKYKRSLYGHFRKPFGLRSYSENTGLVESIYMPLDIHIDYENLEYYKTLAPEGWEFQYLIWMSGFNTANGRNVSLFAFGKDLRPKKKDKKDDKKGGDGKDGKKDGKDDQSADEEEGGDDEEEDSEEDGEGGDEEGDGEEDEEGGDEEEDGE
ncbi:MAG: hypothetical protein OEZ59_10105 [Deltaproteobacteria bacterium]|nr:hypothetical protein [Deltaproteobacteria bacterium]